MRRARGACTPPRADGDDAFTIAEPASRWTSDTQGDATTYTICGDDEHTQQIAQLTIQSTAA